MNFRKTFFFSTFIHWTFIILFLKGRGGEIKHLYRNYAFLYSKLYLDNGGIFVCKTRHLQLAGGNKDSVSILFWYLHNHLKYELEFQPELSLQSHTITLDSGFMSPRISSPMHSGGGGGGRGGRGRGGGMPRRDRELIGQTIKITRGPYKGKNNQQ